MSPDVVVTVRGSASSQHPPELATARLAVAQEGPDRAEVYRRTVDAANALTATVRPLADAERGPVTRWTAGRLHTWSDRPWDPEKNRQGEPVFHAQAHVEVTFGDLDALAAFLDDAGTRPAVSVEELTWALTKEHERLHAREARRRAVHDAAERARDYAEAAGFSTVAFVAVADIGLLGAGDQGSNWIGQRQSVALGMAAGGSGPMGFAPEDITVSATVEARFLAS